MVVGLRSSVFVFFSIEHHKKCYQFLRRFMFYGAGQEVNQSIRFQNMFNISDILSYHFISMFFFPLLIAGTYSNPSSMCEHCEKDEKSTNIRDGHLLNEGRMYI